MSASVPEEMPWAAFVVVADAQIRAATNVVRIGLLIVDVVSWKREKSGEGARRPREELEAASRMTNLPAECLSSYLEKDFRQ
jgi:hypothetical protein